MYFSDVWWDQIRWNLEGNKSYGPCGPHGHPYTSQLQPRLPFFDFLRHFQLLPYFWPYRSPTILDAFWEYLVPFLMQPGSQTGHLLVNLGFWIFRFPDFRFLRFFVLQNHFGKSGGEISRKKNKVFWRDPGQHGGFWGPFLIHWNSNFPKIMKIDLPDVW